MNNYSDFIESYKKSNFDYFELINVLVATDTDFIKEKYLHTLPRKISLKWTNEYHNSLENDYNMWKSKHEYNLQEKIIDLNNKDKEYKHIDCDFSNLENVISMLNENVYDSNCEYNFDLKTLFYIKKDLEKLNAMIGMKNIKNSILHQILYFIQNLHMKPQKDKKLCNKNDTVDYKHTVIYGPPGTGKTEIAEIMGAIYSKIGVLQKGTFKKVCRNDLVAGYLGQTALKTKDVITSCLGGCLFIDEAYSIASSNSNDSYSQECLDTLCEAMSHHKHELMVIVAGYKEEMENLFFTSNKGLNSRFIWRFQIDPYNYKELYQIFKKKILEIEWSLCEDFNDKWFEKKMENFGNYGRSIEQFLSNIKLCHSKRIFGKSPEFRRVINMEDINNGYASYLIHIQDNQKKDYLHGLYV